MDALVDTSVWSLALRRRPEHQSSAEQHAVAELAELTNDGRVRIIGLIRQELLSGVRTAAQYEKLRLNLREFSDEPIDTSDYEGAAKVTNSCMSRGIAASLADALMCQIAMARRLSILTVDPDFSNYARVVPIRLHVSRR
jgi:predicted nucleic acid-binding protein